MKSRLSVLLTTEGTYPFHEGGVSTWCNILVKEMKNVDYILYSVVTNPFISQKFQLPNHVKFVKVPLWGTEEPSEHLDTPFSLIYVKKKRTTSKVIRDSFIPLFKKMIIEILSPHKNPQVFGEILYQLYVYFQEYEYKESFKSEEVWETYKAITMEFVTQQDSSIGHPDIYGLIQSLGWVYRFMNLLNTPVPKSDVAHSSAAAFCGIPCVISKLEHKTPYLLTEHGVYIREQYLSLSKRNLPPFLNDFLIRFIHSITGLNYFYADQVSPVCQSNTRWETRFGVPEHKIQVIYNGIDPRAFPEQEVIRHPQPTVVAVARIDPIKDILSFIKTAAIVREHVPNVKFLVYGSVSVQAYYEECLALRKHLGLEETFIFAGHVTDVTSAYHSGDVIALSSISEGFPYSIVEAMMAGKPIVATDVGGVREAIGETGYLVTPREPEEMASSLIMLLQDESLRLSLGKEARKRALAHFTLEKVLAHHQETYRRLVGETSSEEVFLPYQEKILVPQKALQLQMSERAYALFFNGIYQKAIEFFRLAIEADPSAPGVPVFLSEIATCYHRLGKNEQARNELAKVKLLMELPT